MTDNGIGDEGVKALSEMLKVNKTLAWLTLNGEEERKEKIERKEREKKNE